MFRLLRAALAAVLLIALPLEGPAAAASSPDFTTVMRAFGAQMAPYQQILIEAATLIGDVANANANASGSDKNMVESAREGLAAKATVLRMHEAALRPVVMPAGADKRFYEIGAVVARTSHGVVAQTLALAQVADRELPGVQAGDAGAGRRLDRALIDGQIALMQSSVALSDLVIGISPPGNPEVTLRQSVRACDLLTILLLEAQRDMADGKPVDGKGVAGRMRVLVAEADRTLDAMPGNIEAMRRSMASLQLPPAQRERLTQVIDSYRRSLDIERQINRRLGALADRMAAGDIIGAAAEYQDIRPLLSQRSELRRLRQSLITT